MQHRQRSRKAFAVTFQAAEAALQAKLRSTTGAFGQRDEASFGLRRLDHDQFDAVCGGSAVRASKTLVRGGNAAVILSW